MTGEEIFKLAQKRTPAPDDLSLPDMLLYTSARNISIAYKSGEISLEQARAEKEALLKRHNEYCYTERYADKQRRDIFRISEQVNEAMTNEKVVKHTHMGISALYKIRGVIARYNNGWKYSLELQDLKSGCLVYAALDETEV